MDTVGILLYEGSTDKILNHFGGIFAETIKFLSGSRELEYVDI